MTVIKRATSLEPRKSGAFKRILWKLRGFFLRGIQPRRRPGESRLWLPFVSAGEHIVNEGSPSAPYTERNAVSTSA